MLIYRMISKILEWLGLSKHHMNMKPENTRLYHTDSVLSAEELWTSKELLRSQI